MNIKREPDGNQLAFHVCGFALFFLGSILSTYSYGKVEVGVVGIIFYLIGFAIVHALFFDRSEERAAFNICFGTFWLVASLCAILENQFGDTNYLDSDALVFYNLAIGDAGAYTAKELRLLTEGSAAVILWSSIYEGFKKVNFEMGQYIGVAFNCLVVAISCSLSVALSRLLYVGDVTRMRRMILLCCTCGMYWLFAAIHLRDSVVLLVSTILILSYVWFLSKRTIWRFNILLLSNVGCSFLFSQLRTELIYVPLGTIASACGALILCNDDKSTGARRAFLTIGVLAPIALAMLSYVAPEISDSFRINRDGYNDLARDLSNSDSLGVKYIANQPFPIRAIVGSVYLHIFPIPAWIGLIMGSAYHIIKSANAIYMYAIIPLFVVAVQLCFEQKRGRSAGVLFCGGTALGFTVSVALTSGETRHIGSFYPAILAFCLLPQIDQKIDGQRFRRLLLTTYLVVASIHMIWLLVKR